MVFFEGAGLRTVIYIISFVMIISFLFLVGACNNILTRIGRNSLSIYLLHPLLLLTFLGPLLNKVNQYLWVGLCVIFIALISFFISVAFSNDFVKGYILRPQVCVEKIIKRIF